MFGRIFKHELLLKTAMWHAAFGPWVVTLQSSPPRAFVQCFGTQDCSDPAAVVSSTPNAKPKSGPSGPDFAPE